MQWRRVGTTGISVNTSKAPFLGSKEAPLTIVEYTDFECPYCNQFFENAFPELKKNYIDTGKVRFVSMDLPLEMHRNAFTAAEAGRCGGEQGKFWAMHDKMQGNPNHLEMIDLVQYAQDSGLSVSTFKECLDSHRYRDEIQRDARDAEIKGARGTPAFVIGKSTPTGVEGEIAIGAKSYDVLDGMLRRLGK